MKAAGAPKDIKNPIHFKTIRVGELDVFYREAGPQGAPVIVLLHGYPTSSNMFRNLIPTLADSFRLVALDYPGFGHSSMPDHRSFDYSFKNLTHVTAEFLEILGLRKYSLYVMDYGAPIGYRLALRHPERIQALIVQNGNAYEEGLLDFWDPLKSYWANPTAQQLTGLSAFTELASTRWQYENGVSDISLLDPTAWLVDQVGLDRPGNKEIQMALMSDYATNLQLYPAFQAFFRDYQPPTLIVWGANDTIFPAAGAAAYSRDLKHVETHMFPTGHFALETHAAQIGELIGQFLQHSAFRRAGAQFED